MKPESLSKLEHQAEREEFSMLMSLACCAIYALAFSDSASLAGVSGADGP